MSTDHELAAVPAVATGRPGPGRDAIAVGSDHGSAVVHFKLISPSSGEVWDTPANAGFDRAAIVARLDALRADGHEYELINGDALSNQERSDLYGQASSAVARAGNRYRIRQVFSSRRHGNAVGRARAIAGDLHDAGFAWESSCRERAAVQPRECDCFQG
jgi:hypothetical protein